MTGPFQRAADAGVITREQQNVLEQLAEVVGADFVRELVDDLQVSGAQRIGEMRDALRDADVEALERSAHTLSSMSLTLGFTALGDACRRLELLTRSGSIQGAAELVRQVEQGFTRVTACHGVL